MSFLIYELLLLIRGTRAVQMALSGGFLIGLFFLSGLAAARDRQLGDPESRRLRGVCDHRALPVRHPPRARALRARPRFSATSSARRALTKRSRSWSRRRRRCRRGHIGAIIVVERQIGLRNYIEGGIPLDATVTYDLMATIFQPGSPLHDGAAIVQGDRVAAAACFLPLSVNPRVSRDLGTRHRAAIGLTEENDAVAIVVSEETGIISLAMAGDLERSLTADTLRLRLRSLLGGRRGRHQARRHPEARSSDGYRRFPARRAQDHVDRAGRAALAGGGRRADRRARASDSARVHEHAGAARAGGRAAQPSWTSAFADRPDG